MTKPIVKKPFVNKRNNQLSLSIPRKRLPSKLRYCEDLMFEIKAFRKSNRRD